MVATLPIGLWFICWRTGGRAAAPDMRGPTMRTDIERYIHEQNLILYRKVLSETADQTIRQIVLSLLADEQANPTPRSREDS
jgi:hypothetical protein